MNRLIRLLGKLADACLEHNGIAFHRHNTKVCFQCPNECRSIDRTVASCLILLDLFPGRVPQSSVGLMRKSCIGVPRCPRLSNVSFLGGYPDPDIFACFLVCALSPPRCPRCVNESHVQLHHPHQRYSQQVSPVPTFLRSW